MVFLGVDETTFGSILKKSFGGNTLQNKGFL
jgi:hypothetical protein